MDISGEVYYHITPQRTRVDFEEVREDKFYGYSGNGFIRKALRRSQRNSSLISQESERNHKFVDKQFKMEKSKEYFLTRISDLYDFDEGNLQLFPELAESSVIEKSSEYSSFLCQSGILNYDYLRTLFITQTVNKEGRYQYFVKRDGEYIIDVCDDVIPVDRRTWKPLWGLSYKFPWQLVLLKAWIKECGGWKRMLQVEPFTLLEAFGLPEYKVFNFRKEIRFLKTEKGSLSMEKKEQNIKSSILNNKNIMMVASTENTSRISSLGLIPNKAGYKIFPIEVENTKKNQGDYLYKVETNLPCNWVGKHTAVTETKINQKYRQHDLNLENTIIMTDDELLQSFNKFYAVPKELSFTNNFRTQDCISAQSDGQSPIWVSFTVDGDENENESLCGISIQLPKSKYNGSYPDIRYFLAKQNTPTEVTRSHLRIGSEKEGSVYTSSNCDKWEQFSIDYMQGFHNCASTFPRIVPGNYVLYIHVNQRGPLRIRFDSQVALRFRPALNQITALEAKQIFDSVFFAIGVDQGIETSFTKQSFQESINLNDSFDQLGFASVCIKTLQNAVHNVVMKIHIRKLAEQGIRVLPEYESLINQDENGNKTITLKSQKGRPEIVVMERISRRRESSIGNRFPPDGTFEFFKVYPNKK